MGFDNKFFAEVGGVQTHELAKFEVRMVSTLRFDLTVDEPTYNKYQGFMSVPWPATKERELRNAAKLAPPAALTRTTTTLHAAVVDQMMEHDERLPSPVIAALQRAQSAPTPGMLGLQI